MKKIDVSETESGPLEIENVPKTKKQNKKSSIKIKERLNPDLFADPRLGEICQSVNNNWNKLAEFIITALDDPASETKQSLVAKQCNLLFVRIIKLTKEVNNTAADNKEIIEAIAQKTAQAISTIREALKKLDLELLFESILLLHFSITKDKNLKRKTHQKIKELCSGKSPKKKPAKTDKIIDLNYVQPEQPGIIEIIKNEREEFLKQMQAIKPNLIQTEEKKIEPALNPAPSKKNNSNFLEITKVISIIRKSSLTAIVAGATLGIWGQVSTSHATLHGTTASASASAPAPASSPVTAISPPAASAPTSASADTAASASAPVGNDVQTPITSKNENKSSNHVFDSDYPQFNKYSDTYFKDSPFARALNYAAKHTSIKLEGSESPLFAKIGLYREFLQTGQNKYKTDYAIGSFFRLRLKHLQEQIDRIDAGKINPQTQNIFQEEKYNEDNLLFNAIPDPKQKNTSHDNMGYTIERNPEKNKYLSKIRPIIKQNASGLYAVMEEAFDKIDKSPCPSSDQKAFNECAYNFMHETAKEHRRKNPKSGAAIIVDELHKSDNKNNQTFLGRIFEIKKPVAPAKPQNPIMNNIYNEQKNKINKIPPIIKPTAAPLHSKKQNTFNIDENNWFNKGEQMSASNEKETEENRKWIQAYPEWFPNEAKPKHHGCIARAAKFIRNIFSLES